MHYYNNGLLKKAQKSMQFEQKIPGYEVNMQMMDYVEENLSKAKSDQDSHITSDSVFLMRQIINIDKQCTKHN